MGPLLVLLSAVCFGAMGIFGKLAYEAGVTPSTLLLLRFSVAAAVLGLVLVLRPGLRRVPASGAPGLQPRLDARLLLTAVSLGAVGYALQASLYFAALERIDASLVALLLYTYPLLVTVGAALLGRDRLTSARVVALLVASCGTVLVLLGAGAVELDPLGAALALGGAVTYTVYILIADSTVHRLPPVVLSVLVMSGAAVTLGLRALLTGGVALDFRLDGWLWVACIAVVSTVVAMLSFFAGLRLTGPATASILSTFEPVVTTALAALVLGEVLTPLQMVGGLLVLSCVVLVQCTPRSGRTASRGASPVYTGPSDVA